MSDLAVKQELPPIEGVRLGVASTGISSKPNDLLLVVFDDGANVAGAFTKSTTCSANVLSCRANLCCTAPKSKVLVVNSGNANAFNGVAGEQAVHKVQQLCASNFNCKPQEVFFCSTGIIGKPLPMDKIEKAILCASNNIAENNWISAASAMMTTDTYPKMITKRIATSEGEVLINGICKGSGMIAPNMGTTLAYVFTDADIPSEKLQSIMDKIIPKTFGSITIDGDTSTSDSALLFASGVKHLHTDADFLSIESTLSEVFLRLSQMVVRDAEGTATKLVEVEVGECRSWKQAHTIAMSIANSFLVRCALCNPNELNWGRIVMAIGKTGIEIEKPISVALGNVLLVKGNEAVQDYNTTDLKEQLSRDPMQIKVSMGTGKESAKVWTCDLNESYIAINSSYLT